MDQEYNLMITDFGIAKKTRENASKLGYTKNIGGTLHFLSPEAYNKIFK